MNNIKQKRISSEMLRELSDIMFKEVHNEKLKNVSIMDVKVTNDLSFARVYYTVIGDFDQKEIQEELTNAASFLRTELAKRMDLRNTPELRFEFDESSLYGEHIEEIIEEIHKESE